VYHRDTSLPILCDKPTDNFCRFISGIVEKLDLQAIARVIENADGSYESCDNIAFVVDGKLNRDMRRIGFPRGAIKFFDDVLIFLLASVAVSPKEQQQEVAVGAVEKESAKTYKIEYAQGIGKKF
jgi:hypothetical protein